MHALSAHLQIHVVKESNLDVFVMEQLGNGELRHAFHLVYVGSDTINERSWEAFIGKRLKSIVQTLGNPDAAVAYTDYFYGGRTLGHFDDHSAAFPDTKKNKRRSALSDRGFNSIYPSLCGRCTTWGSVILDWTGNIQLSKYRGVVPRASTVKSYNSTFGDINLFM